MDDLPDPHAARDSTGVPPDRLPPSQVDDADKARPREVRPKGESRNESGR